MDRETEEMLKLEEQDSWHEYLESTRLATGRHDLDYEAVEPWAWSRLQQRLRRLKQRRARLAA